MIRLGSRCCDDEVQRPWSDCIRYTDNEEQTMVRLLCIYCDNEEQRLWSDCGPDILKVYKDQGQTVLDL